MTKDIASFLHDCREQIVSRFVAEVQNKDLAPPNLARSQLVDDIPGLLGEIVLELTQVTSVRFSHDAVDTSATARKHGGQRWTLGYDLEGLIREYGILRHCILQAAKDASVPISIDEFDVLAKCLSVGVAEGASEYIKYRDELFNTQKANLQFIAEAGQLLSSSLDYRSTLRRLTALVVPRLADWCAVYLDDVGYEAMPIAHVDLAMEPVVRDFFVRFPSRNADDGHLRVIRTGEPELVVETESAHLEAVAASPEHVGLMRSIGARSWMILPLRIQQNVFGALIMAFSESGRRYDASDLVLAGELARRAAAAVDNSRLYELSQKERSRVEAATRAKDEFVATVSHELRTPLNAILGWLRLIQGGALSEERTAHALQVIERNVEAQSQIVGDLLDISSVITGRLRIALSQVDLSNVVEMAIEGIRPAAQAKSIVIEAELDGENAIIRGDGDRLQQIAWNLLSNAVKFTPKRGTIRVRLRRVESEIELTVDDTGQGIDPAFLPHVFEIFRQADGSLARTHGGLGIGLSIVKHLVELHGGRIQASSGGRGNGASFVVRLPIAPVVSTTLGVSCVPATQPIGNRALPSGLTDMRVLVVDDDPDARELVETVLETCGVEVRLASSAAEALGELVTYTPDVILSDIGMPDEDGYFLVRSIRTHQDESKRNIPVVALTAFARNEDRTRALVEGFNRHLVKPIAPTELVRVVLDLSGRGVPDLQSKKV